MTSTYLSCAETAKLVRARLKAEFPAVRFSVRSSVYSGGASIRVAWTDGPRIGVVDPIVQRFAGATFDGMTDSMHYHRELQCDDSGAVSEVRYGANFVFCSRHETRHDELRGKAAEMIRARRTVEGKPGCERVGNDWLENLARGMAWDADYRDADPLEGAFRRIVQREEA